MHKIPYGRQHITDEDIQAVVDVLKSEWLTQGPAIRDFEDAFARYVGAKYAVVVSNGTAALHLSALALGLQPGEKVITTPITFVASANCVRYCGGEVVFGDINPHTYLLDIDSVRSILENDREGNYRGIIPVNFAGGIVDLEALRSLADEFGLWIIEDACHSPGGYFVDTNGQTQQSGNGHFAELSIFSFHPVKHIAAGEGGMITTNDERLYRKLLNLRSHGIQQDPDLKFYNHGVWYYEMQELGFNYRVTDFQAALGLSQLKRADQGLERRRRIAERYHREFAEAGFIMGQSGLVPGHAYHLYVVEIADRDKLIGFLREKNIWAQVHYIPAHLMPYYRQLGWKEGDLPHAEHYYSRCLSLPIYPTLTDVEQDFVIDSIFSFYNG